MHGAYSRIEKQSLFRVSLSGAVRTHNKTGPAIAGPVLLRRKDGVPKGEPFEKYLECSQRNAAVPPRQAGASRATATSLTLVPVGPVITRPPTASRAW